MTSMTTLEESTDYAELVGRLSLTEKVELLTGSAVFTMAGNDTIGLAPVNLSDGPTGVRGLKFSGGRAVTLFPNATLLSAAWSTDTAYEVGRLLAEEAMAQDIRVVLGPTINLHRSRARRPPVRGLLRGPAAHRPARRRVRPGAAGSPGSAPA